MSELHDWPIERLVDYARNPRKNDHAVDGMAATIREFGWRVPILAKSDGTVVDGHLRLKAARKLGLESVPVMLCDDMTEAQIKAFRIAVNKTAEFAQWDDDLLRLEFEDLAGMDFDLELTGFSLDEIEGLGDEVAPIAMPNLPSGEKEPFCQMTFTLHELQAEEVRMAIESAKRLGAFDDSLNSNGNGNALACICGVWNTSHE